MVVAVFKSFSNLFNLRGMEIAKSSLIEMVSAMNVLSNADLEADDVVVKLVTERVATLNKHFVG